jgi:hypothetical protein
MACSVYWMLRETGGVDRDRLAEVFADRCEPNRGYGVGAFTILRRIRTGTPWPVAAAEAFGGEGSCGNGAAMRVAPVGAYFPDAPATAAAQAEASAEVTHAHAEGIAGAIAVAVIASLAVIHLGNTQPPAHPARIGRPPAIAAPVRDSLAASLHTVFLGALAVMALAMVVSFFLKEIPLRTVSHVQAAAQLAPELGPAAEEAGREAAPTRR